MKHSTFLIGLIAAFPIMVGGSYASAAGIPAPSASISDAISELAPEGIIETYEKLPEAVRSPLNGAWEALKGFVEAQGAQISPVGTVEDIQVDATTFMNRSLELIKDPALITEAIMDFVTGEYNRVKEYLGL